MGIGSVNYGSSSKPFNTYGRSITGGVDYFTDQIAQIKKKKQDQANDRVKAELAVAQMTGGEPALKEAMLRLQSARSESPTGGLGGLIRQLNPFSDYQGLTDIERQLYDVSIGQGMVDPQQRAMNDARLNQINAGTTATQSSTKRSEDLHSGNMRKQKIDITGGELDNQSKKMGLEQLSKIYPIEYEKLARDNQFGVDTYDANVNNVVLNNARLQKANEGQDISNQFNKKRLDDYTTPIDDKSKIVIDSMNNNIMLNGRRLADLLKTTTDMDGNESTVGTPEQIQAVMKALEQDRIKLDSIMQQFNRESRTLSSTNDPVDIFGGNVPKVDLGGAVNQFNQNSRNARRFGL